MRIFPISVPGLFDDIYAKPWEAEKFEKSVERAPAECKSRLVKIVVRDIVHSDENVVTLRVSNDTDDPITAVSVTARVPKRGLLVYVSAPSAPPEPLIPKWPTPLDEMREHILQSHMAAADYEFGSMVASVVDREDYFEISWNIGNVLARDSSELDVTIVPGMPAPDEIEVELMARSTSHRGVSRSTAKLSVSPDQWQLCHWRNPAPGE